MHRSASVPGLWDAAAAVPPERRHERAIAVIADALDRAADSRLDDAGAVLLDERRAPGVRAGDAPRLRTMADQLDSTAHASRVDGDYNAYVLGFAAARTMTAVHFLARDGGAALPDVAYEAAMACGAAEPVIAILSDLPKR